MRVRHLREADYVRQPWKNGGGWTTQLAASPAAGSDFDWRVSIAEIADSGPFSTFPGCDRHIALLDGAGMRLEFDSAQPALLEQRLQFVRFAGEWKAYASLLDGPVRDFNVISRRERVRAEVLHRPLVGTMVFLAQAHTSWLIHLAAGHALLRHGDGVVHVDARESLLLAPDAAKQNCVLDGGGELVLIKIEMIGTEIEPNDSVAPHRRR
ncbi:MAG: HutD family protein [Rudaea sp.]